MEKGGYSFDTEWGLQSCPPGSLFLNPTLCHVPSLLCSHKGYPSAPQSQAGELRAQAEHLNGVLKEE